jgi:hypothetical protein
MNSASPILARLSRVLPLLLALAWIPDAAAQAPPLLKDGYRNVFGGTQPADPVGVDEPVVGHPLREAYLAQRQGGTAFGGFPVKGQGTLRSSDGVTKYLEYPDNAERSPGGALIERPTVILRSAIIGRPVATFNISYSFAAVIPPPEVDSAGQPVAADYYREEPLNARLRTPITSSSDLTPLPGGEVTNAEAGDPEGILRIGSQYYQVARNPQFYWSPHAKKVYATQPGTITIQWRRSVNTDHLEETYSIATAPDQAERTLYWTENGFTGPPVEVPEGLVSEINLIHNTLVPEVVATPYEPWLEGRTDFQETVIEKQRYKTVYYENRLIHAYNVSGRIFVEYLGNPRADGTSEQKGIEIVNVVKQPIPEEQVVNLGEEVRQLPSPDVLVPKVVQGLNLAAQPYLHRQLSVGGTEETLYAIRETQPGLRNAEKFLDNRVLIYWLETAVLGLQWPKQYVGYVQQWPDEFDAYSIYARPDSAGPNGLAAAVATAVQLDSSNNPALVHQDDPDNEQAEIQADNKFFTKVTSEDPTNRALIRFTRDDEIWFERVYSQLDPYFLDPAEYFRNQADLLQRSVTATPDPSGAMETGFLNISNVQVIDSKTGAAFVEGVDYTVDAPTGVVTFDKEYLKSVASFGAFNVGDKLEVRLFAGYSIWGQFETAGPDWQVRNLSLADAADGLEEWDFRSGDEGFSVDNNGSGSDWVHGPGAWSSDRGGGWGTRSSSLTSSEFTVTQAGAVTLRLTHRHNFGIAFGYRHVYGGQVQYRVNGDEWQTVREVDFSQHSYLSTFHTGAPNTTHPDLEGERVFGGKSANFDFVQSVTSAEIIFTTLPFSEVPGLVDAEIGERLTPEGAFAADRFGDEEPTYVGYIQVDKDKGSGDAYNVGAYIDPFVAGFDQAATGAIIGVNALTGNDQLEVWWYRKSQPTGTAITATYWPSFVQRYRLKWPADPDQIVLASNEGSGDLPSLQATGEIYTQNDPNSAGWNPNEEHALMLNGRAWALRDDLNIGDSSESYVLVHYTEADARPAMRVFQVERGSFDYPAIAGKVLQSPMPLPFLPAPVDASGRLASYELPGDPDSTIPSTEYATTDAAFAHYQKFTWTDRKGTVWVYRGPHGGNGDTPTLRMRYFYKTLPSFYHPGLADQPPVGTIVPYLRSGPYTAPTPVETIGTEPADRTDQPLDVVFRPQWPTSAPELRVGETLTLPKLGLPQVRGQQSTEFIYQQSVAMDTDPDVDSMHERKRSARLFDPTRAKVFPLDPETLPKIPDSVNTSLFLGKIYFPNLPPHLSNRLYFDPAVGASGSLIFKGVYMDEPVGEKYLQLNVMSEKDLKDVMALVPDSDPDKKVEWDEAIADLTTTMETFIEDPAKLGTFKVLNKETDDFHRPFPIIAGEEASIGEGAAPLIATEGAAARPVVNQAELAEVFYSDTAVDSYAVSASGGGDGFVVLATGNGRNTDITPIGNPVSLHVFKVAAPLYRGELKVINSANPLDEKLTLQHTGDFAGHPEEYDFEWRYSPPVDGLPSKLYSFIRKSLLGNGSWTLVNNPELDDLESYRGITPAQSGEFVSLPGQTFTINNGDGTEEHGGTLPFAVLRRTFSNEERPLRMFLSLDVGTNDGAAVYLNGRPVANYRVPGQEDTATGTVPATAPPFDPLPLVFEIDANALVASEATDNNVVTVELYTSADAESTTSFNLHLEGSKEVENLTAWLPLIAKEDNASDDSKVNNAVSPPTTGIVAVEGKNRHTIEGTSILTLSDNWIVMRYRAKDPNHPANLADPDGSGWSKWTEPQLAEGWIKRVLAGINPFQQRVKDLFNHETNTSVSLVEQAGKRWEGDIALNLDNINDSGLIEIYETVLNRGKMLSIDGTPAINYGGANDALLLAAGYLSDLYMIHGNEAFADAANSTIAYSTDSGFTTQYGDVATALFAFKGQLPTVLDEELALLRGRDDSLVPNTTKAPIYNRMIWNYTRGIDAGEAVYALNYNIKDRIWDYSINPNNAANLPTDGVLSAADAAISYPQGHGDAYGHYLTSLTGYYGLLNNPNFTWTPRIEAVLVLGTPVSVDYQDERKFAAAAAAVARSASRALDLTYRQQFSAADEPAWEDFHEERGNANTGRVRNWGTDDWASRGGQGALFHWVTANSLLPAVDPNPNHQGIQKIDRTTVPELAEIAAQAAVIQQTLDNADSGLNPLGLAAGGLAFDISPTEIDAGKTHYEQIYDRAVGTLQNAVDAFDKAKGSTQFLRRQEDTLDERRFVIESQEQAYTNQLIELYGTPYTDDIGPGKTYPQDYAGPDLLHSSYVEITELFGGFSAPDGGGGTNGGGTTNFPDGTYTIYTAIDPEHYIVENDIADTVNAQPGAIGAPVAFHFDAISGDLRKPPEWKGRRVSPGRMQTAVSNLLMVRQDLFAALYDYDRLSKRMNDQLALFHSAVGAHNDTLLANNLFDAEQAIQEGLILAAEYSGAVSQGVLETINNTAKAAAEVLPKVVGVANDASFAARGAIYAGYTATAAPIRGQIEFAESLIKTLEFAQNVLERAFNTNVGEIAWAHEHRQMVADLRTFLQEFIDNQGALDAALRKFDQAQREYHALQAKGDRIQKERLVFRQHAAAIIQGYRTRDFAFRSFRDEALERYNALFDLSARYTYLAASAYDYETGLLDADGNTAAKDFYEKIVRSRALGVMVNGQPQFAGSETGDPGLSGVLAELAGDWSVAKTRLGFNNPDRYRTTFSLRQENFRIIPGTEGDGAWKDLLSEAKMDNILDDPDVRRNAMQAGNAAALAVPGLVLEFSTTIDNGLNFFGKPLAAGDHGFSPTSFATKIRSSGVAFEGYLGMDDPSSVGGALGGIGADSPADPGLGFNDPNALSATPYIYLIPAGIDMMRSPSLGDTDMVRAWSVQDQAIPLPFNIANSDYSTQPAWVSAASLSEPAFMLRKHQAFRAVPAGTVFSSSPGFTNSRLIGRSVWNSRWKIVIPGNTLLNDPKNGVRIFLDTVKDIKLHFETYSYSGN